jgi:hypothetical protein
MLSRLTLRPSLAHLLMIAALSAAPLLTACDNGGPDEPTPVQPGSFTAQVGDTDLTGLAAFDDSYEIEEGGGPAFAVGLVAGDATQTVVLVALGAPQGRTYALSADEESGEAGAFYFVLDEEDGALYVATGGTMTLTHVASDRLRGRFQMTAANLLDPEQTDTLQGSFDAPRGEVDPGTPDE